MEVMRVWEPWCFTLWQETFEQSLPLAMAATGGCVSSQMGRKAVQETIYRSFAKGIIYGRLPTERVQARCLKRVVSRVVEGWVTMSGNQGTDYLQARLSEAVLRPLRSLTFDSIPATCSIPAEEGGGTFKVVKATASVS